MEPSSSSTRRELGRPGLDSDEGLFLLQMRVSHPDRMSVSSQKTSVSTRLLGFSLRTIALYLPSPLLSHPYSDDGSTTAFLPRSLERSLLGFSAI
eukprot:1920143-Rhodomonas_salina.1